MNSSLPPDVISNSCAVCLRHVAGQGLPGGPVYSDENIFVAHFPLLPNEPAYRGHVILEMRRHITSPSQLTQSEAMALGLWTQKIVRAQEVALQAQHVYVVRIGDLTPHLHFHFVPRYAETPAEQFGPLLFRWKDAPRADAQTMIQLTEKLKLAL